jgi:hypothetical protein
MIRHCQFRVSLADAFDIDLAARALEMAEQTEV